MKLSDFNTEQLKALRYIDLRGGVYTNDLALYLNASNSHTAYLLLPLRDAGLLTSFKSIHSSVTYWDTTQLYNTMCIAIRFNVVVDDMHDSSYVKEADAKRRAITVQQLKPHSTVSVWKAERVATVTVKQPVVEYTI